MERKHFSDVIISSDKQACFVFRETVFAFCERFHCAKEPEITQSSSFDKNDVMWTHFSATVCYEKNS